MDSTAMAFGMTPPPTTIKMEDLQVPFDSPASSQTTPPPTTTTNSDGKPVKKRKSWGQVLPEPKTNLPPRKRAKTEDEKEQRRIERVKRNRLAAHNSRERKRQEYEHIQVEKEKLEADLNAARQQMARMSAELRAWHAKYPGGIDLPLEGLTPAVDLDSFLSSPETINPAQTTSSGFPSPVSMTMDSVDSPRDSSCQPETPNFSEAASDFDATRYPAVSVNVSGNGLAGGDLGFPFSLSTLAPAPMDEKPIDNLFDFDQFPDASGGLDAPTGLVDGDVFFSNNLFGPHDAGLDFSDHLDAKHLDLQTAPGATHVSDGALAAGL